MPPWQALYICLLRQGLTTYLWLVWDSLHKLGWSWTYSNPPVSASWILGLQTRTTTSCSCREPKLGSQHLHLTTYNHLLLQLQGTHYLFWTHASVHTHSQANIHTYIHKRDQVRQHLGKLKVKLCHFTICHQWITWINTIRTTFIRINSDEIHNLITRTL